VLGVDHAGAGNLDAEVVEGAPLPVFSSSTSVSGGLAIAELA